MKAAFDRRQPAAAKNPALHDQHHQQPSPPPQQQQHAVKEALAAHMTVLPQGGGAAAVAAPSRGAVPGRGAWYLDAPENEASETLLKELGIVLYQVHVVSQS